MEPQSVLELQEKIRACRPLISSRTLYVCRNGADKSGLMCILSILLDRMKLDQVLTVPLVVGKIKAIRPQVISTVVRRGQKEVNKRIGSHGNHANTATKEDQYKFLYRVLKLASESQDVYANVGASLH
ncbi:receptor-type tyrosine-protein phosphatase mu [Elysia marginata]|uniref:Receptor-type tyrosine-protein phosphatase mu n=1 Tax=Elysia marginata TaxID=1093978 RepID=A0AAV4JX23_9GAST|nr:receptor-type tyrosine-protein phosphatase mu [Elysia marginata]